MEPIARRRTPLDGRRAQLDAAVASTVLSRYTLDPEHSDGRAIYTMKQHLAVSAIGSDRTGMVHELTRVISECGGNITESRMAALGTEFAMLLLVSGNWHALAKLESELARLSGNGTLNVQLKRTELRPSRTDMLPYSIDVVSLDQSGIVSGLSGFFASRGIDIAEVSTRSYPAAHTGAPMFSVQMIVNVPSRIPVAHLREEFMDYCDSLNLDAILEPVKS
jgi:glycine cleavage system transcriptional repressor